MLLLPEHYWLSPEHRDEATAKFARWAALQGSALNLLMITLQLLLAPGANLPSAPTLSPDFVLVGFGVVSLCASIWLALSYRLPARTP